WRPCTSGLALCAQVAAITVSPLPHVAPLVRGTACASDDAPQIIAGSPTLRFVTEGGEEADENRRDSH
ncbi:hypothetical protein BHE74_00023852, partial [Ensete ventricosum]